MATIRLATAPPCGLSGEHRLPLIRSIVTTSLAPLAEAIDRQGLYPRGVLRELASAGAFSSHLHLHGEPGDLGLSIELIAEIARVCGSTGFVAWCQAACGLYLEESGNSFLQGEWLARHIRGDGLGGTGLSNPIKASAGIERLLLRATPEGKGVRLRGSLPWVSHLQPDGYCGVVAAVEGEDATTEGAAVMVLLPASAPGVERLPCPAFSGMEGTSTFALRLHDVRVGPEWIVSRDAAAFLRTIRPSFVLLQCGLALGVIQGAVDSIRAVAGPPGHVNGYLDDQPETLEAELTGLRERVLDLARTPRNGDIAYRLAVLEARAQGSELSLRAAQAALLHQGARGYLASSAVQRRVRGSHFVAIVTPALKQLRKEIHGLRSAHPSVEPPASNGQGC